ncbi:LysR family transcriptional regulator [Paraburkholderia rhizosphaerae]|uniref:LysR family transcriptional regulator n=1 Tax=Paraburkholderia rhizosphaerae TaxID=480658 RepID=A0A4R8LWN2_9BURK|nr:LysR family transcriptional regulator [Paraburkholderia rhizosphaerae]TDY52334.1 LysR family transcriptional regulator [Paraburkholderia rhizosphaerae]
MDYFAAVRAFLHAAELGSFSKAAAQMEIKTSTVSRHINELEADLGIALFNRSTRGLVLTEGGQVFRGHALAAMQSLDEARQSASSLNASPKGVLRVTMPASFGRRHVIPHVPEFIKRYPHIDVDAVVTDEPLNIIEARIDLAIRIGALPDSQLVARRLAEHRRIICASPAYLAHYRAPQAPAELAAHSALRFSLVPDDRWILVKRTGSASATRAAAGRSGQQAHDEVAVQLQGRIRANDTDALLELAIAGCGIALLPAWSVTDAMRQGQLVQLLPDWEAQTSRAEPAVWAVYPPKKTVSSKVRAFLDFYAALFADDAYWKI